MPDAATPDPSKVLRPAATRPGASYTVRYAVHGQVLVATVAGKLTFARARVMSRDIERRLAPDIGEVVLDISGLTSGQDAALLAGLLSVRTTLRRRTGRLTIVAAGRRLDRLVRVSALDDLLTIVPSIGHALTPGPDAPIAATPSGDDVAA